MSIMMLAKGKKAGAAGVIRAQIPYIKAEFPIFILFRALGFVVRAVAAAAARQAGPTPH
jgi:DNA-directed RNA polymerase II subunit RPB2